MANGQTRYHAEVKITIEDREARINVFAETLNEVFLDIGTIIAQFPPDWKSPARREFANADRKAQQQPNGRPVAGPPTGEIPVCRTCGTDEFMESIKFIDKKTNQQRQAWKCQQCKEWYWENGKNGK